MNGAEALAPALDRLRRRALGVGGIGGGLCLLGAWLDGRQCLQSYLPAYLFWVGVSLGCLAIVMLHHLVGGPWGLLVRRLLEAGMRTLPLMAILFVPLLVGLQDIYVWARPAEVAADPLLQHKASYLNVPFFVARAAVYFLVWAGIACLLNRWSLEQDRTGDPSPTRRLRRLSGPGLVLWGLTATFSAVDWGMSLEPRWFSTIYGMIFMAGHGLEALAFAILAAALLRGRRPLSAVASPANFHDLGNLLLAFLMLWAYMAFSQFLIVWVENLRDEIPWYLHRTAGGWQGIAVALIILQFGLPFVLLLSRATKRSSGGLAAVAAAILLMRYVDLFWLVAPAFHPAALRVHWLDLVAPIGIGGLWISAFLWRLKQMPLLPLHDPRMERGAKAAGGA